MIKQNEKSSLKITSFYFSPQKKKCTIKPFDKQPPKSNYFLPLYGRMYIQNFVRTGSLDECALFPVSQKMNIQTFIYNRGVSIKRISGKINIIYNQ